MSYTSANHDIDNFLTCSTKKIHKNTKNMKNVNDAPKNAEKFMECTQNKYFCTLSRPIRCNEVSKSKKLKHDILNFLFLLETRTVCQNDPKTCP